MNSQRVTSATALQGMGAACAANAPAYPGTAGKPCILPVGLSPAGASIRQSGGFLPLFGGATSWCGCAHGSWSLSGRRNWLHLLSAARSTCPLLWTATLPGRLARPGVFLGVWYDA